MENPSKAESSPEYVLLINQKHRSVLLLLVCSPTSVLAAEMMLKCVDTALQSDTKLTSYGVKSVLKIQYISHLTITTRGF